MKKIFVSLLIIISANVWSQDTIVTNLNIRASVINTAVQVFKQSDDIRFFNALLKYVDDYRDGTIPNDNTNVNIDTIYTDVLVQMYRELRNNVYTQTAFSNFASDITSKRNINAKLDAACDEIDTSLTAIEAAIPAAGKKILVGN